MPSLATLPTPGDLLSIGGLTIGHGSDTEGMTGVTVILTTHILEVAERMAERIGVIDAGKLIAEGTLDELRHQGGRAGTSLEDIFLDLVAEQDAA